MAVVGGILLLIDNECPKDPNEMNLDLSFPFFLKVASLVTGNTREYISDSFSFWTDLIFKLIGILPADRLFPLKPKNPI